MKQFKRKKRNYFKEFSHLPVLWSTLCLISLHFPAEIPDESVRARWIWINTGARGMWIYEPWLTPWTLAEPSIPISWADSYQLTVHKTKWYRHKYNQSSKMLQFFKNYVTCRNPPTPHPLSISEEGKTAHLSKFSREVLEASMQKSFLLTRNALDIFSMT